jgi:hypothetical protein
MNTCIQCGQRISTGKALCVKCFQANNRARIERIDGPRIDMAYLKAKAERVALSRTPTWSGYHTFIENTITKSSSLMSAEDPFAFCRCDDCRSDMIDQNEPCFDESLAAAELTWQYPYEDAQDPYEGLPGN